MKHCPVCYRPLATLEDRQTYQQSEPGFKMPHEIMPGICWSNAPYEYRSTRRDPAFVDCLTVALDNERCALAFLRMNIVTNALIYDPPETHTEFSNRVDALIRAGRKLRFEAIMKGVPPITSSAAPLVFPNDNDEEH